MPLKLTRRKGSDYWYIRGTVRGTVVFETTDDRLLAEAIRIKREHELLERSVFGTGPSVTFIDAAASYIESGGEKRFLGRYDETKGRWTGLIGHFGETLLTRIGQAEADAAARTLFPKAGPATRKRMAYVPLCAVLNHAAKKQWCQRPAIAHPSVPKPVTRWSTPERLEKLLSVSSPKLRRLLMLLTYTGVRVSEVLRIDWQRDVRLADRAIHIRRTKNGTMRTVHVPDPLLIELSAVPERERKGQVVAYADKTRVYGPLRRACERAGVDYLPTHQQGRHTYATWLRMYAGLDMKALMEAGGWESVASVARYAHVAPNEAARAADKLPSVHQPCTEESERLASYGNKKRKLRRA